MKSNVLILGAGPAGLALAMKLLQRSDLDMQVTVIDQNSVVGGLTTSFEYERLHFDYGSHRLHPATAPDILQDIQTLLGPDLLDRPRNGRIRLMGHFVKFPLNPLDLARRLPPSFMLGIGKDSIAKRFRPARTSYASFAEVLLDGLGQTICDTFYFPYARKLWGLEPTEIAAVQAQKRVSANSVTKIVRKALASVPGLKPKGAGRFFYPRRGFGQISQALAQEVERLGGTIRLSTRVQEIHLAPTGPTHIRVSPSKAEAANEASMLTSHDDEMPADFVFSTIPVTVLMNCLQPQPPSEVQEVSRQNRYRGMVLCYLVLGVDQFTPYDAHYFPESKTILSRLSEPKNYSAAQEPRGITGLCAELPCAVGDELWSATEEDIGRRVVDALSLAGLPISAPIKSTFVRRVPHVYPIYDLGFETRFQATDAYLSQLSGVVALGRQGLFAHDNTHHTIEMAYRASTCLRPDLSWDAAQWGMFRQAFESHVVED